MMLTAPLLAKSSFWGSIVTKCRQVVLTKKPSTDNHENNQNTSKNYLIENTSNVIKPLQTSSIASLNISTPPQSPSPSSSSLRSPPPNATLKSPKTINTPTPLPINNEKNFTNAPETSRPAIGAVSGIAANFSTSNVTLKTVEEKLGLPPRPKKPLTPYFRFLRDMRPKFQAENPKANTQDVVRALSKEWLKADSNLKLRLQEEYKKEQRAYLEIRTKYDAKLTDEQRADIKQYKQDLIDAKERRMMRQRYKDLGKPRRPASAFLRFIQSERVATPQLPDQTFREWHAKCTAKWSRLSDAEKESYMKEARKDIEKYKKDLAIWEDKMIKLGNIDVVRSTNLIDPPEPKPRVKAQQPSQKQ